MSLKERIEEITKEFEKESLYGRNYCKQEQKPRNPNSIGCCDYCGGEVRLQTLAEAILKVVELDEEKIKLIIKNYFSNLNEDYLVKIKEYGSVEIDGWFSIPKLAKAIANGDV